MQKNKISAAKIAFESFVFGCCETAAKSFFWLPEGANIFKKIGRSIICCAVADETTKWATKTVKEGYEAVTELYYDCKEALKEEENGGSKS